MRADAVPSAVCAQGRTGPVRCSATCALRCQHDHHPTASRWRPPPAPPPLPAAASRAQRSRRHTRAVGTPESLHFPNYSAAACFLGTYVPASVPAVTQSHLNMRLRPASPLLRCTHLVTDRHRMVSALSGLRGGQGERRAVWRYDGKNVEGKARARKKVRSDPCVRARHQLDVPAPRCVLHQARPTEARMPLAQEARCGQVGRRRAVHNTTHAGGPQPRIVWHGSCPREPNDTGTAPATPPRCRHSAQEPVHHQPHIPLCATHTPLQPFPF